MSKIITQNQAVAMIRDNVKGTTFVSIDTSTDPDMPKTNNPFWDKANKTWNIRKLNTVTGAIGADYERAVNRIANKENKDDREAKPRAWGTLTADRLFVEHKGGFYLQVKVENGGKPTYVHADTGEAIDKETIKPFLKEKVKSSTQADLDGEVIIRDFKMASIKSMRFMGESYTIVGVGAPIEYEVKSETLSVTESVPTSASENIENVPETVN